ncbi:MAG: phenylalanine--tRNA ligase subunit beta, partial [Candidatus Omnitrophica bacterium]|nr:phenylalanine--tRNA ligase subunit beta [Candidatus Omnitrophota bacterium]
MDFSLNFIKQFVDIKISAKDLAERLTAAGLEIEGLKQISGDWVFSAEVTTNRYDWLSMVGIGQEVAAVLRKKLKLEYPKVKTTLKNKAKKIIISNLEDCPYYLGRAIREVKIGQSPAWLKKLIKNCGIASVNNVVDITNYCMLKWGNPLHAFDLDKIEGDIYIRRAKKGEKFIGIDQKERVLTQENLVIADSQKVIALAGIMGAKNTEVTASTKNIFLEAAKFSPLAVRHSRRIAGLDTESSYRFERRVSELFLDYASQEATDLIEKLGKGEFKGYLKAGKIKKKSAKEITIELAKMKNYLGMDFNFKEIKEVLNWLNFKVKKYSGNKIKVKPALARFDIAREVDVYEEFARIYGYDKIEAKIPFLKTKLKKNLILDEKEKFWNNKNEIRNFVALSGFSEIITYSMENKEELSLVAEKGGVDLKNPLRSQENSLRPTLVLGMIKSIKHNLNRGKNNLSFFEIADIYKANKNDIVENTFLSLGISGDKERFFLLKGMVLSIANYLSIEDIELKEKAQNNFSNSLEIIVNQELIGFLGKLDDSLKDKFGLKEDLFIAELNLDLLAKKKKQKVFKPFSRFPVVWRDISLAINKEIKFEDVCKIIEQESDFLSEMKIVDTYQGKDVAEDFFAFT